MLNIQEISGSLEREIPNVNISIENENTIRISNATQEQIKEISREELKRKSIEYINSLFND